MMGDRPQTQTEGQERGRDLHRRKEGMYRVFILGCAGLSLPCGLSLAATSGGSSLAAVRRLLLAAASLVAAHRLQGTWAPVAVARRLSCPSAWGIFPD